MRALAHWDLDSEVWEKPVGSASDPLDATPHSGGSFAGDSRAAHTPVMPSELVRAVVADRHGAYVDATFGRGGHARQLLEALSPRARLLVIDRDADAIREAEALARRDRRVRVCRGCFGDLSRHLRDAKFDALAGALFDVGVSSPQLDEAARGFSFSTNGPLDMRMDQRGQLTAAAWLNNAPEAEIAAIVRRYGEEHQAGRVARRIVAARPINTTAQLADAVGAATTSGKQSVARVFQAVRIHINDELTELDRGLAAAFQALAVGGRMGVITFHGLEHRLVRRRFREWTQGAQLPRRLPTTSVPKPVARRIDTVTRGVRASAAEIAANPRARSALLQGVEKLSAEPCGSASSPEWQEPWMARKADTLVSFPCAAVPPLAPFRATARSWGMR